MSLFFAKLSWVFAQDDIEEAFFFKGAWEKVKSQPKAPTAEDSSFPKHAFDYLKK